MRSRLSGPWFFFSRSLVPASCSGSPSWGFRPGASGGGTAALTRSALSPGLSYGTAGGCLQEQSPEPPVTLRDLRPAPKDCRNPGRFLWYFVGFGKAKPMFVRHFLV